MESEGPAVVGENAEFVESEEKTDTPTVGQPELRNRGRLKLQGLLWFN